MIQVLVVSNDQVELKEIEYTLDAMQDIVGGYCKEITISNKYMLIYNADGDTLRLPINEQYVGGPIFGTFFLTRIDIEGGYVSLTDEEVAEVKAHFIREEEKKNV